MNPFAQLREYAAGLVAKKDAALDECVKALAVARLHFGYAPGYYMNTCIRCNKSMEFVDKRCRVCVECADAGIAAHNIKEKV